MNKETLEEAAEKYADYSNDYVPISFGGEFNETTKRDFIEGAKWQQERTYSEEDMKEAISYGYDIGFCTNSSHKVKKQFLSEKDFFAQFKTKYQAERMYSEGVICKHCEKVISVEHINNHLFMAVKNGGLIHWNCKTI